MKKKISRKEVIEAIARGWTHPNNEGKAMNVDLAVAITNEIMKLLSTNKQ